MKFFLEKMFILYHFRLLSERFQFFRQNTSSRIAKIEMYVSTKIFEFFFLKILCVSLSFSETS